MIKDIKGEENWYRIEYSLLSMPSNEICCKCGSEADCFKQEVMMKTLGIRDLETGKLLKNDSTLFKEMAEKLKRSKERVYCDRCNMIKLMQDVNKTLSESYKKMKKAGEGGSF